MSKRGYRIMVGAVLLVFCAGVWALYHWLRQAIADLWCAAWVVAWLFVLWPLVYKTVWRIRVRKP